ncbi:MAG: hypothetical protein IJ731_09030 [Eubacterium sp.]|nr:hypothetical protein [Eubacterium sp.]
MAKLGAFKYSDNAGLQKAYKSAESDYNNWYNSADKHLNQYQSDVDALYNQVMNQEKFSYDPQKDQLFQMYKQQYMNQGNRAMQNQMGIAAAAAGGYNSSAAQTSAQNTFQGYMDALSDKAAQTYQNALDMYKYNQQNILDRFNSAREMNNAGNEAYYKQLDSKAQRMNNAYTAFNNDRNFQYSGWNDNRTYQQNQNIFNQNQKNWKKEFALQQKLYKGK